jgi:hypothetical protein
MTQTIFESLSSEKSRQQINSSPKSMSKLASRLMDLGQFPDTVLFTKKFWLSLEIVDVFVQL